MDHTTTANILAVAEQIDRMDSEVRAITSDTSADGHLYEIKRSLAFKMLSEVYDHQCAVKLGFENVTDKEIATL